MSVENPTRAKRVHMLKQTDFQDVLNKFAEIPAHADIKEDGILLKSEYSHRSKQRQRQGKKRHT